MRHRSRTCLALIAGCLSGAANNPPAGEVTVTVEGLRSANGQVLACLTASATSFPDCRRDPHARKQVVPARQDVAIHFADLPPGRYAIALIHDENANGKPDMALFLPREGFGFSRNAPVRFGPPSFSSAAFILGDGAQVQMIRMRYMF